MLFILLVSLSVVFEDVLSLRVSLTHLFPMHPFCPPYGFLMLSVGWEKGALGTSGLRDI